MPPRPRAVELERWIDATQKKSLLRFITCGSVDDGKSTLIGRLLYDSKCCSRTSCRRSRATASKQGTQGEKLDFALLVDGLAAEREQGITIDVAYRFFATEKRKFIVADTPGHEQYTRNMVTGASTADLAIILIDARKGVLTQTRRHSFLAHLLGIRNVVLAVNKMDLVGYRSGACSTRSSPTIAPSPTSVGHRRASPPSRCRGLPGDNVTARATAMPWYGGPALLEHLETVPVASRRARRRAASAWRCNGSTGPNQNFRGYAGRSPAAACASGDAITVLPSGRARSSSGSSPSTATSTQAVAGQSVTLTLADEVDCSRGDLIAATRTRPRSRSAASRRASSGWPTSRWSRTAPTG